MASDFSVCLNCMINIPIEHNDEVICDRCGSIVVEKRTNCDPVLDFFQRHMNYHHSMLDFAYHLIMPPTTQKWYNMLEEQYI